MKKGLIVFFVGATTALTPTIGGLSAEEQITLQDLASRGYELKATSVVSDPFDIGEAFENLWLQKGTSIYQCSANFKKIARPNGDYWTVYACAEFTK
jgi:hypothetical protein